MDSGGLGCGIVVVVALLWLAVSFGAWSVIGWIIIGVIALWLFGMMLDG